MKLKYKGLSREELEYLCDDFEQCIQESITMRDQFAMAAMSQLTIDASDKSVLPFDIIARDCYELADAMLKARENKP
jgi:hypothetical protein